MQYGELTKAQSILALVLEVTKDPYIRPKEIQERLGLEKYSYYRYKEELNQFLDIYQHQELQYNQKLKKFEFVSTNNGNSSEKMDIMEFYAFLLSIQTLESFPEQFRTTKTYKRLKLNKDQDINSMTARYLLTGEEDELPSNLPRNLYAIREALIYQRVMKFQYPLGTGEIREIMVEPYRIYFDRYWYLWALGKKYNKKRFYRISRMNYITILDETFKMPERNDLIINSPLNTWDFGEEEPVKVVLKISPTKKRRFHEEKLHNTQKIKTNDDDSIDVAYSVKNPSNMIPFILSLGKEVGILEPESLRAAVAEEVKVMWSNLSDTQ